jgi:hypothetical protein
MKATLPLPAGWLRSVHHEPAAEWSSSTRRLWSLPVLLRPDLSR